MPPARPPVPPEPAGSPLPPEPAGSLPPRPAGSPLPPEPAGSLPPRPAAPSAASKARALLLSGVLGLAALALLLFVLVKVLSDSGNTTLGDPTFDVNASALATQIQRDGPVLFPDLLGRGRDIYIQHLGDDRRAGWRAFRAARAGADRTCTLRWEPEGRVFRDPCDPAVTYPEDGAGLEQYQATVQGRNKLVVDLRRTAP